MSGKTAEKGCVPVLSRAQSSELLECPSAQDYGEIKHVVQHVPACSGKENFFVGDSRSGCIVCVFFIVCNGFN